MCTYQTMAWNLLPNDGQFACMTLPRPEDNLCSAPLYAIPLTLQWLLGGRAPGLGSLPGSNSQDILPTCILYINLPLLKLNSPVQGAHLHSGCESYSRWVEECLWRPADSAQSAWSGKCQNGRPERHHCPEDRLASSDLNASHRSDIRGKVYECWHNEDQHPSVAS